MIVGVSVSLVEEKEDDSILSLSEEVSDPVLTGLKYEEFVRLRAGVLVRLRLGVFN